MSLLVNSKFGLSLSAYVDDQLYLVPTLSKLDEVKGRKSIILYKCNFDNGTIGLPFLSLFLATIH
jgi:hypothetical protein